MLFSNMSCSLPLLVQIYHGLSLSLRAFNCASTVSVADMPGVGSTWTVNAKVLRDGSAAQLDQPALAQHCSSGTEVSPGHLGAPWILEHSGGFLSVML